MEWGQAHRLATLLLDWLLHNDFHVAARNLLKYFQESTDSTFYPVQQTELCLRLLHFRHRNTDDADFKADLEKEAAELFQQLDLPEPWESFQSINRLKEPFLTKLVSLGPSSFDQILFQPEVTSVLDILYKCVVNLEIGDGANATKCANEACSVVLARLSRRQFQSPRSKSRNRETNFQRLLAKLKQKKCPTPEGTSLTGDILESSDTETARSSSTVFDKYMQARAEDRGGNPETILATKRLSPNKLLTSPKKSPKRSSRTLYSTVATIRPRKLAYPK